MSTPQRIAILFGGKSAEHEISLISGMNIIAALDRTKYTPLLIGIGKDAGWYLQDEAAFMAEPDDPKKIKLPSLERKVGVFPGESMPQFYDLSKGEAIEPVAAVFSIIHGPMGEDGSLQGLFEQANVPYVGPGVLGSSTGMDKDIFKQLMTQAGILNSKFHAYKINEKDSIDFAQVKADLGLPMFLKPANMGSSVGISKVENETEFKAAVELAFQFDEKVVIEEFIQGREIECAVLGNLDPKGSVPGEVIPKNDFYSYEAKYIDESGAGLEAPAKNISEWNVRRIQALAVEVFQTIDCEGLGRVDFFLKDNGEIYINEINTLPGFTKISMYPRLLGPIWD